MNLALSSLSRLSDLTLCGLRALTGAFLMHETWDNVMSRARMEEFVQFLDQFGFPLPWLLAPLSVAVQFGCGALLVLGLLTRWAGLLIAANFIVAMVMVHRADELRAMWPALVLVFLGLHFAAAGSGRLGLDALIFRKGRGAEARRGTRRGGRETPGCKGDGDMTGYTRRNSLAVGLGMLATACGGGGGSGGSPSPGPTPTPTPVPTPTPTPTASGSIAAAAAAKNMKFGSAFAWNTPGADAGSFNNPNYATLLERDCNILVPENELKWEALRPTSSTFNYTQADQMVAYAKSKGMEIRGHTLLWYVEERFPTWLENYDYGVAPRAEAERLIREHVTQVASHFAADITSWDVVNEAIDNGTGNLRQHSMSAAVGGDASLLDLAFETARDVLPGAELVYNDFMDWGTPVHRNGVLNLLRGFRDRNVPVDTLGIQSHIGFYSAGTAQSIVDAQRPAMEDWLDEVVALGYRLKITEMDINDRNRAGTIAQRDADGATLAAGWLDMLMDYDELDEVLVWGMCDKYSWLQGFGAPRPDGTPIRAAPYNDLFQPKPLRDTYMQAFQNTTARAA